MRTGVEGRGISEHLIWGGHYSGKAPWFAWPAIVLAKLPLALLLLAVAGAGLLWRARLSASARWMLWVLLGTSCCHLWRSSARVASGGGVRHATPLLAAAALCAAVAQAWQRRSRVAMAAVAALFAAAAAMTFSEPRLWEYHNELVGGTRNAYRYFDNESLDLGQRFSEIRAFHDRVIAPSGLPLYSTYWMVDAQVRAARINFHRRVESLDDTNVDGIYDGYFLYKMGDTLPWPSWDWVSRRCSATSSWWRESATSASGAGRQVRPQTRASSLSSKVMDYIYEEGGSDWSLVARRLEEVVVWWPQKIDTAVELGNAYLRLGDGARALTAYRRLLEQDKVPLDGLIRQQLETQIALVAASPDVAA